MNLLDNLAQSGPLLRGAVGRGNLKVVRSMLGPAFRGLIQQRGKHEPRTRMALGYSAVFDWRYQRTEPQLARLYEAAKASQWNAAKDLDWSIPVDPEDPEKPEKLYEINDNLYVIVDALMSDARWDLKFLGMQIMIEGLALGAFCHLRQHTQEPLLRQLLTYVITDEARHVHYGVLALQKFYETEVTDRERREREDWAFEVSLLLRDRFLAHEYYEEHWAHAMSRAEWDRYMLESESMALFRSTMFKRIVPNLKRIGLLSDRVRPLYAEAGLLQYEHLRAAPELTAQDLLSDRP